MGGSFVFLWKYLILYGVFFFLLVFYCRCNVEDVLHLLFLWMPLECCRLVLHRTSCQCFKADILFSLAALSVASQIRLRQLFSHQRYLPALHRNKNHWLSYISTLICCNIWTILKEWRIRDSGLIWLGHVMRLFFKKQRIHWIRVSNSWQSCSLVGCDSIVVLLINSNKNRRELN